MKTQYLQTWHYLGKEKLEKLGEERKVLALIKSWIYERENRGSWVRYERSIKVDQKCWLIFGYTYFYVWIDLLFVDVVCSGLLTVTDAKIIAWQFIYKP